MIVESAMEEQFPRSGTPDQYMQNNHIGSLSHHRSDGSCGRVWSNIGYPSQDEVRKGGEDAVGRKIKGH